MSTEALFLPRPPPPPPKKKFESLFVRPNKNFKILTCTIENYALACHEIETTTLILLLKKSHFSSKKKKKTKIIVYMGCTLTLNYLINKCSCH